MRCLSCDHDNRADRRFCAKRGATLADACPSGGVPVEAGEKFWSGCGTALMAGRTTASPRKALVAELGQVKVA
jgi:hypothetical protein